MRNGLLIKWGLYGLFMALLVSCVSQRTPVIVMTATPMPETVDQPQSPTLAAPLSVPTPDPTRPTNQRTTTQQHVVQSGDTLFGIAQRYNISLDALLSVNSLADPNVLSIGQVIQLPGLPGTETPNFKIIPDSRLVLAPGSSAFDVAQFVAGQPGYIRTATDDVPTRQASGNTVIDTLTAAQVVQRVAQEYGMDARLLLVLLQYRAGWLTEPAPGEALRSHPLISEEDSEGTDRSGLYRQLIWAANELNKGYYDWKYRGLMTLEFEDGTRFLYAPPLNAGTVGMQYFLSLNNTPVQWSRDVAPSGFYQLYVAYFGDPFPGAYDPIIPPSPTQPDLALPFASGEVWYFTGGPHGGWGSGSAWSALDFAPPDDLTDIDTACYVSEYWMRAVAPGVIARSDEGVVILDLDSDGDETTGWTVLYLHLGAEGRAAAGTFVQTGAPMGHPSCAGGFSTATHAHIALRYNGEWIPADCHYCTPGRETPPLVLNGWRAFGFDGQQYQGYLQKDEETVIAEQGRTTEDNHISW